MPVFSDLVDRDWAFPEMFAEVGEGMNGILGFGRKHKTRVFLLKGLFANIAIFF
jgi:hypothetical protein